MRRSSLLALLPILLLFSGCDAADPLGPEVPGPAEPTVLELLTAHRWYNHAYTVVDLDTGEELSPDVMVLPVWYEFEEDGILRGQILDETNEVEFVLADDGSYFVAAGNTFYIEELTGDTLRFYYEAFGYGITVTCHPTEPED